MFEGVLQPMHLILILFIALLVFGPSRLPELGHGLGTAIREFRSAFKGEAEDRRVAASDDAGTTSQGDSPPGPGTS